MLARNKAYSTNYCDNTPWFTQQTSWPLNSKDIQWRSRIVGISKARSLLQPPRGVPDEWGRQHEAEACRWVWLQSLFYHFWAVILIVCEDLAHVSTTKTGGRVECKSINNENLCKAYYNQHCWPTKIHLYLGARYQDMHDKWSPRWFIKSSNVISCSFAQVGPHLTTSDLLPGAATLVIKGSSGSGRWPRHCWSKLLRNWPRCESQKHRV